MMTKLAHMRANRKNNKGFSLVELIIVIAIMVALIAVMGPQYVKYIQKSRDSALANAAEDLQQWVKAAIADQDIQLQAKAANANITVSVNADGVLTVAPSNITILVDNTRTDATAANLAAAGAGFSTDQKMGTTKYTYTINVSTGAVPNVTMTSTVAAD